MKAAAPTMTLADMRTARNLSLGAAAALLAEKLGEDSRTSVSYHYIEKHGTTKHNIRKALAAMYGVEPDQIDAALDGLPPRPRA